MGIGSVGLNQQMLPVFLGILLAAAVAWLFLSNRLYGVLRQDYPELYGKLGCPNLFMKKSFITNINVLKFVLRKEYTEIKVDTGVLRLCQGLRSLFFIYVFCLAGSLLLIFAKTV
jgi:hypothetical protein